MDARVASIGSHDRRDHWSVLYIGLLMGCAQQYLLDYNAIAIKNGNTSDMIGLPR